MLCEKVFALSPVMLWCKRETSLYGNEFMYMMRIIKSCVHNLFGTEALITFLNQQIKEKRSRALEKQMTCIKHFIQATLHD